MELAQTLQPRQSVAWLEILEADDAFERLTRRLRVDAVFFCS